MSYRCLLAHSGRKSLESKLEHRSGTAIWITLLGVLMGLLTVCGGEPHLIFADDATGVRTSRPGAKQLPLTREDGVWHFAIFGDRTSGPPEGVEILKQAVRDTNLFDPDLVMTVGDLIEGYNDEAPWLDQMREFREAMDPLKMPWYPVAGNHDVYWRGQGRPRGGHEANFEKHFGPLWYWFPHKDAAFVVLYTDEGDPKDDSKGFSRPRHTQMSPQQLTWLEKTLQETSAYKHVFVFLHHPRWIREVYRQTNWDEAHQLLASAGNVKGVFAGHIHRMHYAGMRDGVEYFALGTTGGSKSHELPQAGWTHHFNIVTVRDTGISVVTVPVGTVVDPRQMTPLRRTEIDKLLALKPAAVTGADGQPGAILLQADGSANGTYPIALENPTSKHIELTVTAISAAGWRLHPDHFHASLQPGEKTEVPFYYQHEASPDAQPFQTPRVLLNVDYIDGATRITLPEREIDIEFELASLPDEVFVPTDSALTLDGTSCVRVSPAQLKLDTEQFTLEAWVYPQNLQGRRPLLAKAESSEFCIFVSHRKPSFSVFLNGSYATAESSEPVLNLRQWQHLAGVYDGRELRLYLNGKQIAASAATGKRKRNALPFFVGADPNGNGRPVNPFRGQLDEVRLSSTIRYQQDFTPASRFEPDDATVLLYHFDRTLGPFVPDHSPARSHARIVGTAHTAPRLK